MECSECGSLGIRFVAGKDAAREWEDQRAFMGEDVQVPEDADVLYCGACDHAYYVDRIQWERLDKDGVHFDEEGGAP